MTNDVGRGIGNQPENHDRASTLAKVIKLSEDMVEFAQNGQWGDVARLESLRQENLRDCFPLPALDSQSELFAEALAVVLHLNEEVICLLESAKKDIAVKRTDQKYVRSSLQQYLSVDGD
jgi:hypothetical protein